MITGKVQKLGLFLVASCRKIIVKESNTECAQVYQMSRSVTMQVCVNYLARAEVKISTIYFGP